MSGLIVVALNIFYTAKDNYLTRSFFVVQVLTSPLTVSTSQQHKVGQEQAKITATGQTMLAPGQRMITSASPVTVAAVTSGLKTPQGNINISSYELIVLMILITSTVVRLKPVALILLLICLTKPQLCG